MSDATSVCTLATSFCVTFAADIDGFNPVEPDLLCLPNKLSSATSPKIFF